MEIVSPGSEGDWMVEGVSQDQCQKINEFLLGEQSCSRAAFGNQPML